MFLQKKTHILEHSSLTSLLKAISNNSEILTESEISNIVGIQEVIKSGTKLELSEEARLEYYQFLEKVILLDNSLNEGVIDYIKNIGTVIKHLFKGNLDKDWDNFKAKYKFNDNSFMPSSISKTTDKVVKENVSEDKALLKKFIRELLKEYKDMKKDYINKNPNDKETANVAYDNLFKTYTDCLDKL